MKEPPIKKCERHNFTYRYSCTPCTYGEPKMKPLASEIQEAVTNCKGGQHIKSECVEYHVKEILKKRMPKRPESHCKNMRDDCARCHVVASWQMHHDEWTDALGIQHEEKEEKPVWCEHITLQAGTKDFWYLHDEHYDRPPYDGHTGRWKYCPVCSAPRPKPPTETGGEEQYCDDENCPVSQYHPSHSKEHVESVKTHNHGMINLHPEDCPACQPKPSPVKGWICGTHQSSGTDGNCPYCVKKDEPVKELEVPEPVSIPSGAESHNIQASVDFAARRAVNKILRFLKTKG